MRLPTIILCLYILAPFTSYGYINYIDSLHTNEHLLLFDSIVTGYTVEECCDTTLYACLSKKKVCLIARRFNTFAAWLVLKGNTYDQCITQLNKRYVSFRAPDTCTIAPISIQPAGDPASPVTITVYVSASCPLCKKVTIPLHMAVTGSGRPLAQKARLVLKPVSTGIGDRALLAADAQGKFWDFFLSLEDEKRRLDERIIMQKAKKIGCDMAQFEKDLSSAQFEQILQQSRAEASALGATITPAIFINNRRYQSYKDPQWVIDAVEYEYDEQINRANK